MGEVCGCDGVRKECSEVARGCCSRGDGWGSHGVALSLFGTLPFIVDRWPFEHTLSFDYLFSFFLYVSIGVPSAGYYVSLL